MWRVEQDALHPLTVIEEELPQRQPAGADEHKGEEGRFDGYFSADPGEGD